MTLPSQKSRSSSAALHCSRATTADCCASVNSIPVWLFRCACVRSAQSMCSRSRTSCRCSGSVVQLARTKAGTYKKLARVRQHVDVSMFSPQIAHHEKDAASPRRGTATVSMSVRCDQHRHHSPSWPSRSRCRIFVVTHTTQHLVHRSTFDRTALTLKDRLQHNATHTVEAQQTITGANGHLWHGTSHLPRATAITSPRRLP